MTAPERTAGQAADRQRPLVSCVMPTRDRRPFVGQAIDRFLAQDYTRLELVVVDDGEDLVADLIPRHPRVRYRTLVPGASLGEKRNRACQAARGEIIVHWDDDDWSAPWRVSYQVAALERRGLDLVGLDRLLFFEPATDRAWWYVYPQRRTRWLAGGTLCYRKRLWERSPFPDRTVGEDNEFVARGRRAGRIGALPRQDFYVASIHPGNTSPRRTKGTYWRPCPVARVREVLAAPAPSRSATLSRC